MGNDFEQSKGPERKPMPLYKAIGGLLLVYASIGGYALWQLRQSCLLEREDCDASGLLESVLSNRLTLIGSILVLAVLLQITWHFIGLARSGRLGVEEDPPEPRFDANGVVVAIVVFVMFLAISLAVLFSAIDDTAAALDPVSASMYVWKLNGPLIAAPLVFGVLWMVNDYFSKPAPGVALLLLFFATFGALYWAIKTLFLDAAI